ncbi:MAG TPA: hypothetical protein DCL31_07005 [Clostridium sp.]|nr:hypothetical protein [Clostridium sp.]
MKIFVRFGHEILTNGSNTSAVGYLNEYAVIREYAPKVVKYLQDMGHTVKVFNPDERKYSSSSSALSAGVSEANSWGADLFVSCHVNAYTTDAATGSEVWYYTGSAAAQNYAANVSREIASRLSLSNRGAKASTGLYELSATSMTAIIIEPFFVSTSKDCNAYKNTGSDKLARAIVKGLTGKEPSGGSTGGGTTTYYRVVVGSYNEKANADKRIQELKSAGISDLFIDYNNGYYRVIAGSYTVRANAESRVQQLKVKGFDCFIAVYEL